MSVFKRFQTILGLMFASFATGLLAITPAHASMGQPSPWQLNLQDAATPMMERMHDFHNLLVVIITAISVFVLILLIIVCVRFNKKANPTPSKTSHNTIIEIAWTVIPMLILIGIAVPSFKILYDQRVIPETDITIKATGYQWYWGVEYPGMDISFDQLPIKDEAGNFAGNPRLLETDYAIVLPVDTKVGLIVTASDVIHAWTIPSFGVKIDAIPGRLNEAWFETKKVGVFYGQCSEICGAFHAFMPITVKVVPRDVYDAWVEAAKTDVDEAKKIVVAWQETLETKQLAAVKAGN